MKKFDEHEAVSPGVEPSRSDLETRIRELETENNKLQAKIVQLETEAEENRFALEWHRSFGLPQTADEARNPGNDSFSLSEVLIECERELSQ